MVTICRDCAALHETRPARCSRCGGGRLISHGELTDLAVAHIDCDAFYASVEKRDNPAIAGRPVIVGGGRRGVVSACCYIARISGVRSAMPMFQALKLCPKAVVIKPDMAKYKAAGAQVRALMQELTPLVEPLSIDEAFLDLSGTRALHKGSPAETLVRLVRRIEEQVGVTASVGLSYNKFLAKVASDLDKPRGFAVLGRSDALQFLETKPASIIWGVGQALARRLERDGIRTVGDLRRFDERDLTARYGAMGRRLWLSARGEDDRQVSSGGAAKSVSAETTFERDTGDFQTLKAVLWRLCEEVSSRLKAKGLSGGGVVLKMKTAKFRQFTRSRQLDHPTQSAEAIYQACLPLLRKEADGTPFRLLGAGVQSLAPAAAAQAAPDLLGKHGDRQRRVEDAMDALRGKFGQNAIRKGRSLDP